MTAEGLSRPLVSSLDRHVRAVVERDRSRRLRRAMVATVGTGMVVVGLLAVTMLVGSYALSLADVVASLLRVNSDRAIDFVVWELRLPTAVAGLGVGLALGVAGRTFQTLLRNPLASPDIVGVSSGASLAAVAAIVLAGAGGALVSGAALVGALVSCALVYVLAWRGGIAGYRFILIGIGVAEFMLSLVAYLIARAEIYDAREALTWLVGSLGFAGTGELVVLVATVTVAVPLAVVLGRPMRAIELGDDAATALGVRVEPARLALIGVAVVLVAVATAAAGPLAFVALVAGPVAGRLLGGASGGIFLAGLVGASICLSADLIAEHVLPVALPTGVVTGLVGAPYLVWLLVTMNREGRGG